MFEDINRKTVYIMGKKFLECPHENCEWNIGWLGGIDWTEERGAGTRSCDLGANAMINKNAFPPDNCPHPANVIEMARAEFEF
jgi:hypothetical protein